MAFRMGDGRRASTELPPGFVVIDLETTTSEDGALRAVDGRAIYLAGMHEGSTLYIHDHIMITENLKVLAGHNIKFDLEHIRRADSAKRASGATGVMSYTKNGDEVDAVSTPLLEWVHRKGVVLDTQFITYLHSGHHMIFPSLEKSCEYWGVPLRKTLDLSVELPKVGYDITKIPDLHEYLFNDLEMTSALLMKQLEDPWVKANFPWILQMHQGLMGTFDIEYNGMHVDPTRLTQLSGDTLDKLEAAREGIRNVAGHKASDTRVAYWFDPASNDHIAALLFGGDVEFEVRVKNGVYATGKKAGEPKFKIERFLVTFPAMYAAKEEWKSAKTGKYSVSEDVLSSLTSSGLVERISEFRELSKLYGTYLDGLRKHIRVSNGKFFVFPQINVCQTATGRTSSSKPNMQNNPTHDSVGVASIYTSRYGEGTGILLEVDFKQIEILALAILSGDKVLRDDILAGRDIHTETGKLVFGSHMTKEQRRVVKSINFGLIYGGGYKKLSKEAGVSETLARDLIAAFYKRYPQVKLYFDAFKRQMQDLINTVGRHTGVVLDNGSLQKACTFTAFTGRRYTFKDYYSEYSKTVEVSHTETRNYPIQGLATGDLVLSALGMIWRHVLPKYGDDVKIVGLVHDSLRFDLKVDRLDELLVDLKYHLENSGEYLNKVTVDAWDLPIQVSFSKGTDFFNMNEFTYP